MPQIAEIGEHQIAPSGDGADIAPVERWGRGAVGPLAYEEEGDQSAQEGKEGRSVQYGPPVAHAAESIDEMRRGRAEGESSHQQADAQASVLSGPGSHDFHADRVN